MRIYKYYLFALLANMEVEGVIRIGLGCGKPSKNATAWKAFDFIRGFTLFLSFVNVILKVSRPLLTQVCIRA